MREVIIPLSPGILCAQGLVVSDLKEDFVASARIVATDAGMETVATEIAALRQQAADWFAAEGISDDRRDLMLSLDMRYVGQNFELSVSVDALATSFPAADIKARFFEAHEMNYGYFSPDDPVEIVNFRLTAVGRLPRPDPATPTESAQTPVPVGERAVYFDAGAPVATALYERDDLQPGMRIAGPAVIDQLDSTTLVFPGDTARVDGARNLIIELAG